MKQGSKGCTSPQDILPKPSLNTKFIPWRLTSPTTVRDIRRIQTRHDDSLKAHGDFASLTFEPSFSHKSERLFHLGLLTPFLNTICRPARPSNQEPDSCNGGKLMPGEQGPPSVSHFPHLAKRSHRGRLWKRRGARRRLLRKLRREGGWRLQDRVPVLPSGRKQPACEQSM